LTGTFIFSIDTELGWGPTKIDDRLFLQGRGQEDRDAVQYLLMLLDKYGIRATWAIVGHLFLNSCDKVSCITSINKSKYNYDNECYYDPHTDIFRDSLYYGRDLVEMILRADQKHEIGYHSFSHPIFSKIPHEMADIEIREVEKLRSEFNLDISSFVYPADVVNHSDILKKYNFKIYREKTPNRYKTAENFVQRKIFGLWDKLIAAPVQPRMENGIIAIPSSMCFCDPQLPELVLPAALIGLKRAIKKNMIFHIYIHPWNLLLYEKLRIDLRLFLDAVHSEQQRGNLDVITMGECADEFMFNGGYLT
jgi:peptidoglycan/xylan/chitin deacetylase (PgdA/CDA1 family)